MEIGADPPLLGSSRTFLSPLQTLSGVDGNFGYRVEEGENAERPGWRKRSGRQVDDRSRADAAPVARRSVRRVAPGLDGHRSHLGIG